VIVGALRTPNSKARCSQCTPANRYTEIRVMSKRNAIAGAAIAIAGAAILAAFQDQQSEAKLPPPFATPSSTNRPVVVTRPDGAKLQVPKGFQIEEYATGFQTPRFMLLGPGSEIL